MSDTLAVYTFSNGDVAKKVLEAITTFLGGNDFANMLAICAIIAVAMTAMRFFFSQDPRHIGRWAAVYLLVPLLLIQTKADVQIIDASNPMAVYHVSRVPLGVALPTHLASTYMYGVTRAVESVFHAPNDAQYTRTGMLFGSTLYRLSSQPGVAEAELKGLWAQYIRSCIYGDITLNQKYTWEELKGSNDIWAFLASHKPSPLRRIHMDLNGEEFPTCQAALPELKKRFETEAGNHLTTLGKVLYGERASQSQAFLQTALVSSARQYLGISRTASQIMLQNMTTNALRNGLMDNAARANASAAAMNYAYTQNRMQTTSMWAGMALQARDYLPMMQSILFLLFSSASILVLALAMLPGLTLKVLFAYLKGFINLGTWPVLFALLNFIMTTRLSLGSSELADLYGGLSLSNLDALTEMHHRYASMTGFLMMSIPFIVHFLVQGGGAVMGSLANQFSASISGVNTRTSAAVASGDISQGNTQFGNHSWNMTSANKSDSSWVNRQYGYTQQNRDGTLTTSLPNGKQVYNSSEALSKTDFDINSHEAQTRALTWGASAAHSATLSSQHRLSESLAHTGEETYNFTSSTGRNFRQGEGVSAEQAASVRKASNIYNGIVESFAQSQGVSHEKAASALHSVTTEKSGNWDFSQNPLGKAAKKFLGISGDFGVSAKQNRDSGSSDKDTDTRTDENSSSRQEQFTQSIDTMRNVSSKLSTSASSSEDSRQLSSLGNSFRQTEELAQTVSANENKEHSLTQALQDSQNHTLGMNENLNQQFQEYMEGMDVRGVEEIMYGTSDENRQNRQEYFRMFMEEKYAHYDGSMRDAIERPNLMPTDQDIHTMQKRNADGLTFTEEQQQRLYAQSGDINKQRFGAKKDDAAKKDTLFSKEEWENAKGNLTLEQSEIASDLDGKEEGLKEKHQQFSDEGAERGGSSVRP